MRQPRLQAVAGTAVKSEHPISPWFSTGGEETRIDLGEYWRVLKRGWWIIVFFLLLGAAIGYLKAGSETPIYRATLSMLVEPDLSRLASVEGTIIYSGAWRFYETQYELLRSRALAERVVDKLGMVYRNDLSRPRRPGPVAQIKQEAKALFGFESAEQAQPAAAAPALTPEQEQQRRDALAGVIQAGVSVKGGDRTELVQVSYDSPNPEFAAEAANALVDAYIELGLESRLDRARRVSSWLTERIEGLRQRLLKSEETLQEYQNREGLIDLQRLESMTTTELSFLKNEVVKAQQDVAELSKRYGPKHPKMITARTELETANRRFEELSKETVNARAKEFELAKLEREVASNRQLYDAFIGKFKETDLSEGMQISNARVVDRARVPKAPYTPNVRRIVSTWTFVGLALGLFLVFLREFLDNTFKSTEQIENKLNLPVLGVMPLLSKRAQKRERKKYSRRHDSDSISPERHFIREIRSGFSESVNHIRTGITYSNVDDPPTTVVISSAIQSEGKTTLATNLALSFAQLGPTLIIDADLRKPRVEKITQVESLGGLVEYVAGTRNLHECIVKDKECDTLYVLRSGTIPPNPLELLSSKKLSRTLEELRKKFAHIVIDTAPILPVSDPIVLGHIADAFVMVVQAERTTQKMVHDAVRRLQSAGVTPLGVVLSQVHFRRSTYYYDGKYQYYYHGYYGQEATKAAGK